MQGFTPLHVAARCGRLGVLRTLLDAGVPVDSASTPAGTTPLHLSAGFSRERCVEELLKRGANPSEENKRGATPLDVVGTLIPTSGRSANASSHARATYEKKLEQRKRLTAVLAKAQKWQRRRNAMLLFATLQRRARVASKGGDMTAEARQRGDSGKRRKPPIVENEATAPWGKVVGGDPVPGGWVIAQLCAHPQPLLMRNVIGFL